MARLERPIQESSNPATKFLNWKSNDKCFSYYEKTKQENVLVTLPLKFVFLEHYHTIKGWNKRTESGIYSNEVFLIGKEQLTVKTFKGDEIAAGIYSDIRTKVKDAGGVYHRSIYIMLENGDIANLQLKGSAVSSYSDFFKENKQHIENDSWVEIVDAKEGKKGSVKFTTPFFNIGNKTTKEEESLISKAASELQLYMNDYFKGKQPELESAVDAYEKNAEEDEIDF